jgi:cellobiose-specific phosphotransferase system component IIC
VQVMFGFSAPGIIGFGFAIAIILIIIGLREKDDYFRKVRYIRSGGIIFGIMIIVTVVIVYAHLVTMGLIMKLQDVITLALVSSFGGLIIGISGYYPISQ